VPIQTCFETERDRQIFEKIYGNIYSQPLISFRDWLYTHFPHLQNEQTRLETARLFTQSKLPAEQWLPTVELLRSALVLNAEQVHFCFNQLPSTAKNRALKECFLFYLNSPLSNDENGVVWNLLSDFKKGGSPLPFLNDITFIPSSPSTYLFQEMCEATRYCPAENQISFCTFAETFGDCSVSSEPGIRQGHRLLALEALAQSVSNLHLNQPDLPISISFLGSLRSKHFLKYRLSSLGVPVEDCTDSLVPQNNDPWTLLLSSLRKTGHLPIEEKFSLNSTLLFNKPFSKETLIDYLERLSFQGFLKDHQLDLLKALGQGLSISPQIASSKIRIVPWMRLPPHSGESIFAFCDESLQEVKISTSLLSENELDALFLAGFQLPRRSHTLNTRLNILEYHARHWPSQTYTSLPVQDLSGFQVSFISSSSSKTVSPSTCFQASLKVTNLSATQLETYADCPSKYLFRRLKLQEPSIPLSDFSLHLGQAVHKTLESLFSHSTLPHLDAFSLRETFSKSLRECLPNSETTLSRQLIYLKAFDKIIPRIVQNERALRNLFGSTKTLGVEKDFSIELQGTKVIGKIDRVDLLENDQLLILDYKTGSVDFTPDHLAQGNNFQALLYWLGAQEAFGFPPAAMIFYDLKKGELKRGLAREECVSKETKKELTRGHTLPSDKLDPLIEAGLQRLQQIAQSIRSGNFAPSPSNEACRFCEAPAFCRQGVGYV